MAPRGRAAQPSRDNRMTNQAKQPALSSPSGRLVFFLSLLLFIFHKIILLKPFLVYITVYKSITNLARLQSLHGLHVGACSILKTFHVNRPNRLMCEVNIDSKCCCKTHSPTSKIVSEYDQEIPQSQTADNPVAPRGRAAQPSRDTRKTN